MRSLPPLALDTSIPVLLAKMRGHPLHYGGLALARSVGECGVPVVALVEDRRTPLAESRFVTTSLPAPAPDSAPEAVVRLLLRAASACRQAPLTVPTDDEMAVFLDEHQAELRGALVLNSSPRGTARRLSDKGSLHSLAKEYGVEMPHSVRPTTFADLETLAGTMRFPVVIKYSEPFTRLSAAGAAGPAVAADVRELFAWARTVGDPLPAVQIQEYVPDGASQIWIYNGLRAPDGRMLSFTGRTLRSWPPGRGAATFAISQWNPDVARLGETLMSAAGLVGPCDLDFVHDSRDGTVRLLDFNPRYGASAAMFRQDNAVDLIRANHLGVSGRDIPPGEQVDGRTLCVEPMDLRARRVFPAEDVAASESVTAFWRNDDPRPAVAEWSRFLAGALTSLGRRLRPRKHASA